MPPLPELATEYYTDFLPIIERLRAEKAAGEASRQKKSLDKLMADMAVGGRTVIDVKKGVGDMYHHGYRVSSPAGV